MFKPFSYWSSSSIHHPETLPYQISYNHDNCNITFPLINTFSDQITICKMGLLHFACKIFRKMFCGIIHKVDYIAYEHHWLFWNALKILLWVNLCKNNHYFDQKQPIFIIYQHCLSLFRRSKLIKMYRQLLFLCIIARV